MSEWSDIRERYLRDGVDIRLGGLAANLARIGSFSRRSEHASAVSCLIRESALFIEWTAVDAPEEVLPELGFHIDCTAGCRPQRTRRASLDARG